jgi:hypothetical protein
MEGMVAAGLFVVVVVVLSATVPMWGPVLWRWLRQDEARLVCAELDRWEREMDRQRLDYEAAVIRAAQRRGLPDADWPALAPALARWWQGYRDGRISWQTAYCEAESWISRRVRLAEAAARAAEVETDVRGAA